ncbi:MAG: dihydrodipicolinate synthase family protein [Clostridia bacterium]|nr:dihydrodipicolinate synthase family protein [Clostridia bacterium]
MKNKQFSGIMPALITPINDDGSIREAAARSLIESQIERGVSGFYICGSTGEGPVMSEESRMRMAEITVDQVKGRVPVINHVGACDARSAVRLAKHAEEIGCDAISSVPPNFYYSHEENEIVSYYRALSDACAKPLLVYATGMFKQADIVPVIARLMEIDTVIGLKFTRMNYYEMRRIIELNGGDINVINGPDEMLICGLTMGADAGIGSTYNVMPGEYVKLFNSFRSGDFAAAQQQQYKINHAIEIMLRHSLFPALKHMLTVQGFDVGVPVFPMKRFTPEEEAALMKDLNAIRFFEDYR